MRSVRKTQDDNVEIVIFIPVKADAGGFFSYGFTPALGFLSLPPLLFPALQGSTEDEQHTTKGTSLIESQHHHLLHCLEKTTVSSNTTLPTSYSPRAWPRLRAEKVCTQYVPNWPSVGHKIQTYKLWQSRLILRFPRTLCHGLNALRFRYL